MIVIQIPLRVIPAQAGIYIISRISVLVGVTGAAAQRMPQCPGASQGRAGPRRGAEGPVAFIHPRSCHGVLVELIEAPGGPAWTALGLA